MARSVGAVAGTGAGTGVAAATGAAGGAAAAAAATAAGAFRVSVGGSGLGFSAAHFVAFRGFRERLHGHDYRLAVSVSGRRLGPDGYLLDFSALKKIARALCAELHEAVLVPMASDALAIRVDADSVHMRTEDDARFCFPRADCALLPIAHSSAEELARYLAGRIVDAFTAAALLERGASAIEVSVSEAERQLAACERAIVG